MIYLGGDHRGYELKETIKEWLDEWSLEYEDMGPEKLDQNDDYPDFISKVAKNISVGSDSDRGVILGYTGQGEAMVANRFKGVRAAVFYGGPDDIVRLSREHNDANVLSLGAGFVDKDMLKDMLHLWLTTSFSKEERHVRRIRKIEP